MKKQAAIELKDIVTQFGNQVVHDRVSIRINKGEIHVIVGPSGVGKTVLLRYMLGLAKPVEGHVFIDGVDITKLSKAQMLKVREKFGVVFQSSALLDSINVYDNVALPLREKTKLSENEIAQIVEKHLKAVGLPDGWHKFPSQLSGGMKKRVALARALTRDPEIILFDEPTTGLDPDRKNSIYAMLRDLHKKLGFTAVIVSHDIPKIFHIAHRLSILYNGKMKSGIQPKNYHKLKHPWVKKIMESEFEK
ncbi:MAG: ATP-binding cassette domain-containing protein [Candidatus Hydrogenedentota bacterium]|nr:MAG: ATP-binding cassette domain-containing protein [Candidatus Hydrogenedentota bacterium]